VDLDSGELYLGELNPRVSGASSMTNVTAGAYADMPLFLFHLLEYMDVEYELDVDEINQRWARSAGEDVWSQLIIKETGEETDLLTSAPRTGVWKLDEDGRLTFARWANDWHNLIDETEAFYLRVAAPGEYRFKGADLGVLVTRGRLQTDDGQLTERCRRWIEGVKTQFAGTPVAPADISGSSLGVAFKKSGVS
jgi:biotin carboxylase